MCVCRIANVKRWVGGITLSLFLLHHLVSLFVRSCFLRPRTLFCFVLTLVFYSHSPCLAIWGAFCSVTPAACRASISTRIQTSISCPTSLELCLSLSPDIVDAAAARAASRRAKRRLQPSQAPRRRARECALCDFWLHVRKLLLAWGVRILALP